MAALSLKRAAVKTPDVSLSTSEAEFVAASQAGQEALYLCESIKDFDHQQQNTTDDDDDCFYYDHSWRNNVVIAFGTLSSFLT